MGNNRVKPYFTQETYKRLYLTDPHFTKIRQDLIIRNPSASCWICGRTDTLLPHHIHYQNLYHEKKMRMIFFWATGDIAIVCFACHTKIHFIRVCWLWKIRLPRKKRWLVKRMQYLKVINCIQNKRFMLSLWYTASCMVS